ncbi:MAG: Ig-like domain-containing protein, partial [Lachnospiraceae bacterium]|nr:Ig-like domain-containing protein [Lachnospiraceae bacterium]
DKTQKIDITWVCDGNYDEYLGTYTFKPDMHGYTLAADVSLPVLTVTFEKEKPGFNPGRNYIPVSVPEVPHVTSPEMSARAKSLPSKLDNFKAGVLPPVRDQGHTGTCWAHGTIGMLEADLIHDKKAGTDIDLSEKHLVYYLYNNYEDPTHTFKDTSKIKEGVDYLQIGASENYGARVLSNLVGAVPEKLVPLDEDPTSFKPDISYVTSRDTAQVRQVYYINHEDRDAVKLAICDHGAVAFGCFMGGPTEKAYYYTSKENAYYCPKPNMPNHTMMLVGWDDTFSRMRFTTDPDGTFPEGDGAWLVRNSWGLNDYGLTGYFWLSYYDKSICMDGCPIVAADAVNGSDMYKNCYCSDRYPFTDIWLPLTEGYYTTVKYKVSAHEAVKAVCVEVDSYNSTMNVSARNTSTGQTVSGTVTNSSPGLYSVVFDKPLQVYDKATVEVRVSGTCRDGEPFCIGGVSNGKSVVYGAFEYNNVCDTGYYINDKVYMDDADLRIKLYTDDSKATYKKVTEAKLDKKKVSLKDGTTLKLKATVKPANATYKVVKWSSSDESIATVSDEGIVTAHKPGKTKITARPYNKDGKKATCTVTVVAVPVKGITLNKSKVYVGRGGTVTLKAVIKPENASNKKIKWRSKYEKIATVDKNGVVTAKKEGETKITVITEDGHRKAFCKIKVTKPVKVKSVKLDRKKATINVGESIKLKATVKPKKATIKTVTWKSSNKKVATVTKKGKVKGIKKGSAKITVTTKDGKKKATCTVTVK